MPMLTDLAQALRSYRAPDGSALSVEEVAGWAGRGYAGQGLAGVAGAMWHHTATASSAFDYADCPTLNILVNGHSSLPGPLCNLAFGRSGKVYVVAAGLANHAGAGSVQGAYQNIANYWFIGVEMESSGVSNDWTPAQLRVMPHVYAALEAWYGDASFMQLAHREYSSMGKIDPAFIDMDGMRSEINSILYGGVSGSAAAPQVYEEDELAGKADEILNLLKQTKNRVDILWGGMFTEFSYSGTPDTQEPGVIPRLKELKRRQDIIWGSLFQSYSMTGRQQDLRPGVFARLDTIENDLKVLRSALQDKAGGDRL